MPDVGHLIAFALIALGMVLTPGPNMVYLVSRTLMQGRAAGLVSLLGVAAGFLVYLLCTALGLTALLVAVPFAYDALRLAGAAYLLFLAWQAVRPGGASPFAPRRLTPDGPGRLFAMGLLTNLLNPKIAVMYLSLLPHFIAPERGGVLAQSLALGLVQIAVSLAVNMGIVLAAGSVAAFLTGRPLWLRAQRWLMGTVLAALALRMATDTRR